MFRSKVLNINLGAEEETKKERNERKKVYVRVLSSIGSLRHYAKPRH